MNSRQVAFGLVVASAMIPLGVRQGHAAEPTTQPVTNPQDPATALRTLGPAASPDAVLRLARAAGLGDAIQAVRFAGALSERRSYVSARALSALVWHRDPSVRIIALQALAQMRLRIPEADMDAIRSAVKDREPGVREAAYAAIGAIGDGTDVPALLDAMDSGDAAAVAESFAALRDLSGARLRCRIAVWRQWRTEAERDLPAALAAAFAAVEAGEAAGRADALRVIERGAWIRLAEVRDRLAAWCSSDRPDVRREAYRLVAHLRLGDLAERLATAMSWERDEECLRVGAESAQALGVALTKPATAPAR